MKIFALSFAITSWIAGVHSAMADEANPPSDGAQLESSYQNILPLQEIAYHRTQNGFQDSVPVAHPDGFIVFASYDRYGISRLALVNTDGTERAHYSTPGAVLTAPIVLPQGNIALLVGASRVLLF